MHILFIGEDERFKYAKQKLVNSGLIVQTIPPYNHIVLPMKGCDATSLSERIIATNQEAIYYVNNETTYFKEMKEKYLLHVVYLNENASFNEVNNLATAEGVMNEAIVMSKIILKEMNILILGYGSSAKALVEMFFAHNSQLTVGARRPEVRQTIEEKGHKSIDFCELRDCISTFDMIINTVPALVIDEELLHLTSPNCILLDIATAPGGIDYNTAKELGLSAHLLPGLPAKVAPKSSGYALAQVILSKERNYA